MIYIINPIIIKYHTIYPGKYYNLIFNRLQFMGKGFCNFVVFSWPLSATITTKL